MGLGGLPPAHGRRDRARPDGAVPLRRVLARRRRLRRHRRAGRRGGSGPRAGATTIVSIAREEMAHLLTEQNLLRFIGGPLNFEREDFPFRSTLYPFPLHLRAAEQDVAGEVRRRGDAREPGRARTSTRSSPGPPSAAGGMRPNRVGVLFDTLLDIFADEAEARRRRPAAADSREPAGEPERLVRVRAPDRARRRVARRGGRRRCGRSVSRAKARRSPPPDAPPSHFDQFLGIYREFPETEVDEQPDWVPTRSIPTNPTTAPGIDPDAVAERGRITHPTTRLWAQLFNVRYRMLLADLAHALHLSGPLADAAGSLDCPRRPARLGLPPDARRGAVRHARHRADADHAAREGRRRRRAIRSMRARRSSCPTRSRSRTTSTAAGGCTSRCWTPRTASWQRSGQRRDRRAARRARLDRRRVTDDRAGPPRRHVTTWHGRYLLPAVAEWGRRGALLRLLRSGRRGLLAVRPAPDVRATEPPRERPASSPVRRSRF